MYLSNLSQLADVTAQQRREMDEQLGRLVSMWTRRVPGRRRSANSHRREPI